MVAKTLPWIATCLATLIPVAAPGASNDDSASVPASYLGTWAARGACSSPKARLVITSKTAAFGTMPPAPVVYVPNDDPSGRGALHWAAEYDVDNFELVSATDTLIYNSEGYGMPGQIPYKRCPRQPHR